METTVIIRRLVIIILASFILVNLSAAATEISPIDKTRQYSLLQGELSRYYEIEKKGGWQKITLTKKHLQKGETSPAVVQLKQRLSSTADYTSSDMSDLFTDELTQAVKRVQKRFGFPQNGVVDAQLVKELNVAVQKRIDQLLVNIERLKSFPAPTGGTRLIANIPEFKLRVYEGERMVFDMNIVVGKESTKSVIFDDVMEYIVFSPSWHVPPSIVKNEILPAMKGRREYLWRNNYVQTGTENGLPVIKQLPGPKNALGKVKFVFPNSHNIYFHDTPAKSLFELRRRAFSHGCIRLAEPAKLAEYLLKNSGWTPSKIKQAMDSGKEQFVKLPNKIPVSITYFTAWVDDEGLLHFREDIYGHDSAMAKQIAKKN